jgi:hypothetical protein
MSIRLESSNETKWLEAIRLSGSEKKAGCGLHFRSLVLDLCCSVVKSSNQLVADLCFSYKFD